LKNTSYEATAANTISYMLLYCCAVVPLSGQAPVFTTLYRFNENANNAAGQAPSGLAADSSGVLYGTTLVGGTYNQASCGSVGCGTVFSLSPPSSPGGAWAERVLWNFGQTSGDRFNPVGAVVIGTGGVLYGVTAEGGGYCDRGVVFALTPPVANGAPWTESILWTFGSIDGDGKTPQAGLTLGAGRVLYGTTSKGGGHGNGTVFALAPPATEGEPATYATLWRFGSGTGDGYARTYGRTNGIDISMSRKANPWDNARAEGRLSPRPPARGWPARSAARERNARFPFTGRDLDLSGVILRPQATAAFSKWPTARLGGRRELRRKGRIGDRII
jgi:uncharacterized repeat protein (TIGR03803 family)